MCHVRFSIERSLNAKGAVRGCGPQVAVNSRLQIPGVRQPPDWSRKVPQSDARRTQARHRATDCISQVSSAPGDRSRMVQQSDVRRQDNRGQAWVSGCNPQVPPEVLEILSLNLKEGTTECIVFRRTQRTRWVVEVHPRRNFLDWTRCVWIRQARPHRTS